LRALPCLVNPRHLLKAHQQAHNRLAILHLTQRTRILKSRLAHRAFGRHQVAATAVMSHVHGGQLRLKTRQLLPRALQVWILVGGKLAHRLNLDLLGRYLGAQHGRRRDHRVGLAVHLNHAGALLGLLHLLFGSCQILTCISHLPLEEEPSSGRLTYRQARRKAPVFLHPAVGHLCGPARILVGHRKANQPILQPTVNEGLLLP